MKASLWVLVPILLGCSHPQPTAQGLVRPLVKVDNTPDSDIVRQYLARKERWAVKTGADARARRINLSRQVPTTVAALTVLKRPPSLPKRSGKDETRYAPVESTLYTVNAEILRYKLETDDQDIHIVIRDPGGKRTMVVEIPDPSVVSHRSPFWPFIRDTRQTFFASYKPKTRFTRKVIRAQISGVGFFDFLHGQSGLAPNGIELHPVLGIKFLP